MATEGFLLPGKNLDGAPKELDTWIPDKVPIQLSNRTVECTSPTMYRENGVFYGDINKFKHDVREALPINREFFEVLCERAGYDFDEMDKWAEVNFKKIGQKHEVGLGEYWFAGFDGGRPLLVNKESSGSVEFDTAINGAAERAAPELAKFAELERRMSSKRHALGGFENRDNAGGVEDANARIDKIFKSDMHIDDKIVALAIDPDFYKKIKQAVKDLG